jgi:hypothetical protein
MMIETKASTLATQYYNSIGLQSLKDCEAEDEKIFSM